MFRPIAVSAPGKVILSGEHAVVHGTHAVATVIAQRTYVGVEALEEPVVRFAVEGGGRAADRLFEWPLADVLRLGVDLAEREAATGWEVRGDGTPDEETHMLLLRWAADLPRVNEFVACSVVLYYAAVFLRGECPCGFAVTVRSEVPMSAGLGSSASFCVAMAAAFFELARRLPAGYPSRLERDGEYRPAVAADGGALVPSYADRVLLNRWAYQGECIIHGNPSGVDNTVAVHGGALVYRRGHDNQYLSRLPPVRFLVTNTGVPRDTKRLVAGVGELLRAFPKPIGHVIDAMDGVALRLVEATRKYEEDAADADEAAVKAAEAAFVADCGTLMTVNQHLLNAVGVGHVAIDRVVFVGSDKYGLPTKLTGAGGGGCVISLVPPGIGDGVVAGFERDVSGEGFEVFETTMGQDGVVVYGAPLDEVKPASSIAAPKRRTQPSSSKSSSCKSCPFAGAAAKLAGCAGVAALVGFACVRVFAGSKR